MVQRGILYDTLNLNAIRKDDEVMESQEGRNKDFSVTSVGFFFLFWFSVEVFPLAFACLLACLFCFVFFHGGPATEKKGDMEDWEVNRIGVHYAKHPKIQ